MLDSPKKTAKWMQSIFFPICHFRGWQFWRLANLPPNLFLIPGSCGFFPFPFLTIWQLAPKSLLCKQILWGVPLRYGVKRRVLGMRGPGRRESLFFSFRFPNASEPVTNFAYSGAEADLFREIVDIAVSSRPSSSSGIAGKCIPPPVYDRDETNGIFLGFFFFGNSE